MLTITTPSAVSKIDPAILNIVDISYEQEDHIGLLEDARIRPASKVAVGVFRARVLGGAVLEQGEVGEWR